jgi:hypothetical protein
LTKTAVIDFRRSITDAGQLLGGVVGTKTPAIALLCDAAQHASLRMTLANLLVGRIHPSVYRQQGGFLRLAVATVRPHGTVRYVCPATGSFVLLTDDATLHQLAGPRARLRCPDCGEIHLLLRAGDDFSPMAAKATKS